MFSTIIHSGNEMYGVELERGAWISVCRGGKTPVRFEIGDVAEYDSYNLKYTGVITGITEKTVTIVPRFEKKARRLKLAEFSWRNWNFDSNRVAAENSETMMYI